MLRLSIPKPVLSVNFGMDTLSQKETVRFIVTNLKLISPALADEHWREAPPASIVLPRAARADERELRDLRGRIATYANESTLIIIRLRRVLISNVAHASRRLNARSVLPKACSEFTRRGEWRAAGYFGREFAIRSSTSA
jgi:hypothetical protein